MPAPLYTGVTGGAVALTGGSPKTILGAKAHANSGLLLRKVKIGFDGVTASAVPVAVEICYCTFASNPPGTASTSVTPAQENGRVLAAGFTMGKNWSTEPTVITVLDEFLIPAFMGQIIYDIPLGDEYDTALGEGFAIRCTAAANVNARGTIDVNRC